jgi:hypothetical protein
VAGGIQALGGASMDAGDDVLLNGGSLTSKGAISIAAGTDGTGSIIGNSSKDLDIISLGTLTLKAPDSIGDRGPVVAQVMEKAIMLSSSINADISTTPLANPLSLSVSDIDGGPAAKVVINAKSRSRVTFDVFNVNMASVKANTPVLQVPEGNITNYAEFLLPNFSARIDTLIRASSQGYDVNALSLDGDFSLDALVNSVSFDAFILGQNPNLQVAGNTAGNAEDTNNNALNALVDVTDGSSLATFGGTVGMSDYSKDNSETLVDVSPDRLQMNSKPIPVDEEVKEKDLVN